jgi:arylsulfatase A-like enzyme
MQEQPETLSEDDISVLEQLYDAEVRYVDEQIGRLFDTLEKENESEDTVVAFTADHGEAFGEHGRFGHHVYAYDELIRVPLVIGGGPVTNKQIDEQVQLLDLPPTLLDLVGLDPSARVEGESFASVLTTESNSIQSRPAMIISENGQTFAVRTDRWKYIDRPVEREKLLYDLQADPNESINVTTEHPDMIDKFENIIEEYKNSVTIETASIDRSEQTKERLQNLGYIEE